MVVDNGSSDDTRRVLEEWQDGLRRKALRLEGNRGFAAACNAGARSTDSDFIVFLNNDTFVLPGWLPGLLEPFSQAEVAVTGSRLLYPNGRIQHAGVGFDDLAPRHAFVGVAAEHPLVMTQRDWQAVTGASMAVRREVFERLDGFDESYRNSFEDVDFCLRVIASGGRVVYCPGSVAYHFESMTEGRIGESDEANYALFMQRWRGRYRPDLPEIMREAERDFDLSDRQQEITSEWKRRERLAQLEAEVEPMRRQLSYRSVRAALWARNSFRRIFPRRRPPEARRK